jgi:tetratricopeptide (TPR) repeat protein
MTSGVLNRCNRNKLSWSCRFVFCAALLVHTELFGQNVNATRLTQAAKSLAAGHLDLAEAKLNSVLRNSPQEYRALDLLGVVRVLQRRQEDAEELFRRAVQAKPEFAGAHAHLGLLYLEMGRTEEAVPELREAVRLDPLRTDASAGLVKIWRDQAQAAMTAGNPERALALLIDARKAAPNDPDIQYGFGMVALQMSLFGDAIEAFRRTLQLRENDPLAFYGLGRAFMGLAKFEEARQQFVQYVVMQPNDASGHCALGMTLAAIERSAEARKEFERSIAIDPARTESYYRLGLLDLESKNLDLAVKRFQYVLEREPKHSGALLGFGKVEFEQKHYVEAVDLLQRAVASDHLLREAHYYLGLTYARMGRKTESDQELQSATKLERDESEQQRVRFKVDFGPAGASNADPTPRKP